MTTFTFTRLKHGLKVVPSNSNPFTLSMRMWQNMTCTRTLAWAYATRHGYRPSKALQARLVLGVWCDAGVSTGLYARKLIETVRSTQGNGNSYSYPNVLTALGEALHVELPPCPPRAEWSAKAPARMLSPENIKMSQTQKKMLREWPRRKWLALPIGGDKLEECRWRGDKGMAPTIRALLRMELVEPGITGIVMVNGKCQLDPEGGDVGIVYRPTIAGALIAGCD